MTTDWLKQQLEAAVAENPDMPIFVTAPTSVEGSALTVSDVTFATAKVAFPAATHDDYVHNYNIRIKQGDTVVLEKLVNGDF